MSKINHIKIGGFCRLEKVDLPVRPFMVLIGANGVGKSSLLDAFPTSSHATPPGSFAKTISRWPFRAARS